MSLISFFSLKRFSYILIFSSSDLRFFKKNLEVYNTTKLQRKTAKERLQKKTCERYQNLSKKEKETKQQYYCECYKNLSEYEN